MSSPENSDKSDGYQTTINRFESQTVAYQSSPTFRGGPVERSGSGSTQRSDNKIRIKINQKN